MSKVFVQIDRSIVINVFMKMNREDRKGNEKKTEKKKKSLEKCFDKHTTKPSIIYLVLFIEFPVYVSLYVQFVRGMSFDVFYRERKKNSLNRRHLVIK